MKGFYQNDFITWNFILERSPWWGGFYKGLVGALENSLKKILGRVPLTDDEIHIVICEL